MSQSPALAVVPTPLDAVAPEATSCSGHGIEPAHFERALLGPARDFLARPGKAFRSRMIELCALVAGGPEVRVPRAALEAVELLHGGSLIIDDIQDDAEQRRGAPALHRVIGAPLAINVGNWLYFAALARLDELELSDARALALTRSLHVCLRRCHEGQALDLGVRIDELPRHEVAGIARTTSQLKTGALMGFAARLGAVVADASDDDVSALVEFGERAGVALQMLDDLGSMVSAARADKALEDLRGRRVTWAWAWASETLDALSFKQLARMLQHEEDLDEVRERLSRAVGELGRERVQRALRDARNGLAAALGDTPYLDLLTRELGRLEKSYG